jgi:hypothetical protein
MYLVGVRYIPRQEVNVDAIVYITPQHPDFKERRKQEDVVECHGIELQAEPGPGWIVIHHFFPKYNKLGRLYLREADCDQFFTYADIPDDMIEQAKQLKMTNGAVGEKIELPGLLK